MTGSESIPLQWPLIRVFWSGTTMINIFFITTGYVLSYKPLRQMYSGNISDAHRQLTSSTIRRGLRLYIPTLVAIFTSATLSYLGVFDGARSTFDHENHIFGLSEASPPHFVSFIEQMKDAGRHTLKLLDLWHQTDDQLHAGDYDLYTWAIPVEFRNSLVLILALFAVSRFQPVYRLVTTLAFIAFSTLTQNRNVVLFLSGMLIADIDQMRFAHSRHVSYSSYYHETSSKTLAMLSPRSPVYPVIFLLGMLICSIPVIGADQDILFKHLYGLVPDFLAHKTEWIRAPGSLMIVWAVANSTVLRPIFTNRVPKYLGRISFALYLVHGSVLKLVLHNYIPLLYSRLGDGTKQGQSTWQFVTAWAFGAAMSIGLSVWVADVFWRVVDLPTVRVVRLLEGLASVDDEVGGSSPKRRD